jgi:hypothetical protein
MLGDNPFPSTRDSPCYTSCHAEKFVQARLLCSDILVRHAATHRHPERSRRIRLLQDPDVGQDGCLDKLGMTKKSALSKYDTPCHIWRASLLRLTFV